MSAAETAEIVERIVATWPTGPRGFVWTEALSTSDITHAEALAAYRELRDAEPRITVARLLAAARSIRAREQASGWERAEYTGPTISLDEFVQRHPDSPISRLRARS